MFALGGADHDERRRREFRRRGHAQFGTALEAQPDLIACEYNTRWRNIDGFSRQRRATAGTRDHAGRVVRAGVLPDRGRPCRAKRFDEALRAWENGIAYEPGNPDLQRTWLTCTISAAIGNSHQALHPGNSGEPGRGRPAGGAGIDLCPRRMFSQAVGALTKSLELNPRSPVTHSNLGLTYYLSSKWSGPSNIGGSFRNWTRATHRGARRNSSAASTIPSSRCGLSTGARVVKWRRCYRAAHAPASGIQCARVSLRDERSARSMTLKDSIQELEKADLPWRC